MSKGNQVHWTEDEDLLERYVLGRVDPSSREALKEHLRHCDTCRQAVRHEQVLAAGIRRMGRDSLRKRLARRLDTAVPSAVPWTRILAAAAVITIIIGVGTYYRWYATQPQQEIPETATSDAPVPEDKGTQMQEERPRLGFTDSTMNDRDLPGEEPGAPGRRGAGTEQRSLSAPSMQVPPPQADYRSDEKKVERDAMLETEGTRLQRQKPAPGQSGAVGEKTDFAANAIGADAAAPTDVQGVLWIDGILLAKYRADGQSSTDLESLSAVRKGEASPRPSVAIARGGIDKGKTTDHYSVMQRPLSALPRSQQTRQQHLGSETVQTLIQKVNDSLQLILFTDMVLDSGSGRKAVVHAAGKDSLIVEIDSQTIVYHLPEGWDRTIDRAR